MKKKSFLSIICITFTIAIIFSFIAVDNKLKELKAQSNFISQEEQAEIDYENYKLINPNIVNWNDGGVYCWDKNMKQSKPQIINHATEGLETYLPEDISLPYGSEFYSAHYYSSGGCHSTQSEQSDIIEVISYEATSGTDKIKVRSVIDVVWTIDGDIKESKVVFVSAGNNIYYDDGSTYFMTIMP